MLCMAQRNSRNQAVNSQLTEGNLQVDLKGVCFEVSVFKFKSSSIQFLKKVSCFSVNAYVVMAEAVDF